MKRSAIIRTAVILILGLGIGSAIAYYQISNEKAFVLTKQTPQPFKSMAGVDIGGPFTLTDHTGQTVTENNYNDEYKLIYFGFTFCPSICPTELQKISAVYERLEEEEQNQVQPLFITLDPERDTVEVMHEYVQLFHPDLIGLRGNEEQTEEIKKSFRIFSNKVQTEEMSDYTIDHSSFIYLMSPDNSLLSMYRMKDDADFILNDMRKYLPQS